VHQSIYNTLHRLYITTFVADWRVEPLSQAAKLQTQCQQLVVPCDVMYFIPSQCIRYDNIITARRYAMHSV